jgi:hypothetical protein
MALFANSSNSFSVKNGLGFTYSFPHSNTADRAYVLPDSSGKIALISNLITSLTGDVTASGTGAIATTIANSAVTKIKIASAAVDSTKAAALSPNNIAQTLANTGDVLTWTGSKYAPRPVASGSSGFSAVGGTLTGTGGAGFFGMLNQSAAPSTVSGGLALFANASNALSIKDASGFVYSFSESNTADRLYTLQNATGTIPLLQSTQTWTGVNSFTGTNTGFGTSSPSSLALIDAVSTTLGTRPFTRQTTSQIAANYSGIATTTLTSGGTGYTNGSYTSIALTGGTGTGAIASITVAGGIVTVVTITTAGSGYQVGDVLSAANTVIGSGSGSGLVITVATITTPPALFVYNTTTNAPQWNDGAKWNRIMGQSITVPLNSAQIAF